MENNTLEYLTEWLYQRRVTIDDIKKDSFGYYVIDKYRQSDSFKDYLPHNYQI